MKKKLLLIFTDFQFKRNFASRFLQSILLFLPLFFFSVSTESHDLEEQTDAHLPESSAVIYMVSGSTMVGSSHIHQTKIVHLDEVIKKEIEQKKYARSVEIISTKSLVKRQKFEKKVVKKEVAKIKLEFCTNPADNSDFNQKSQNSFRALTLPNNRLQKSIVTNVYFAKVVEIEEQLKKQKNYFSLFFLQLPIFQNSSLRGPPTHI